ncbi:MAG: hypothetical protein IIA67_06585 [Planctomycetes bacterium]|nr:hypothetical protein [Planctomycetota bacterium]
MTIGIVVFGLVILESIYSNRNIRSVGGNGYSVVLGVFVLVWCGVLPAIYIWLRGARVLHAAFVTVHWMMRKKTHRDDWVKALCEGLWTLPFATAMLLYVALWCDGTLDPQTTGREVIANVLGYSVGIWVITTLMLATRKVRSLDCTNVHSVNLGVPNSSEGC